MFKIFLSLFFLATLAFGNDDANCRTFCDQCRQSSSDLCVQVDETCSCASLSIENDAPEELSVETEVPEKSAPVLKADFALPPEKHDPQSGAILNVNFGYKGDDSHTAVLQADGSYEIEEKSNTGALIAVGASFAAVIILALIFF